MLLIIIIIIKLSVICNQQIWFGFNFWLIRTGQIRSPISGRRCIDVSTRYIATFVWNRQYRIYRYIDTFFIKYRKVSIHLPTLSPIFWHSLQFPEIQNEFKNQIPDLKKKHTKKTVNTCLNSQRHVCRLTQIKLI